MASPSGTRAAPSTSNHRSVPLTAMRMTVPFVGTTRKGSYSTRTFSCVNHRWAGPVEPDKLLGSDDAARAALLSTGCTITRRTPVCPPCPLSLVDTWPNPVQAFLVPPAPGAANVRPALWHRHVPLYRH